jgi:hypothetical protein
VAVDIADFVWPIVIFSSRNRIGYGVAIFIVLGARAIRGRALALPEEQRSNRQRQAHAILTVLGYLVWIVGIIYGDICLRDRAMWALSTVLIPILCLFCYMAVRVNLGLERPWGAAPERT